MKWGLAAQWAASSGITSGCLKKRLFVFPHGASYRYAGARVMPTPTPSASTRLLLAAALLALAWPCRAEDEWFGGDKRAHFIGGLLIGGVLSAHTGSHSAGVLTGCGVGAVGELIEAVRNRGFTPGSAPRTSPPNARALVADSMRV